MLGTGFGIIVHSHHAGMCVLASHCVVAYTLRVQLKNDEQWH